jgi:hypothetical protein
VILNPASPSCSPPALLLILVNLLNAELNPICHLLVLLGDLKFMGSCIVSIFEYISNHLEKTKYICIEEEKESLKFDSREEIKPSTECTYLGTKIDQTGDNTTEIKHRINQRRNAINALNSIW